jgi:hypothetical protein
MAMISTAEAANPAATEVNTSSTLEVRTSEEKLKILTSD